MFGDARRRRIPAGQQLSHGMVAFTGAPQWQGPGHGEGTAAWWDQKGVPALSHKKSSWEEALWPSPAWEMMALCPTTIPKLSKPHPAAQQIQSCFFRRAMLFLPGFGQAQTLPGQELYLTGHWGSSSPGLSTKLLMGTCSLPELPISAKALRPGRFWTCTSQVFFLHSCPAPLSAGQRVSISLHLS